MKINAISHQQTGNKNFKAIPVGEARNIVQQSFRLILSQGSEADIQNAKVALYQLKNIGKHFNGYEKELILRAKKLQNNTHEIFADNDIYGVSVHTGKINSQIDASNFLNKLASTFNNSILGKLAKLRDSKYEAEDMMNMIFGEVQK